MQIKGSASKRSIIVLAVLSVLALGFNLIFMLLIDCHWYAYLILGIILLLELFLIIFIAGKRWQRVLVFLLAISLSSVTLIMCRPSISVSFTGTLVRESIRLAMQQPAMKGDGLFKQGADLAAQESTWEAPADYRNTRYDLTNSAIELLRSGEKQETVIYQLHGGAYMIGFMDTYRDLAVRYSKLAQGADVASLDYRIAPAFTYPAALDDAIEGWEFLLAAGYQADHFIVVGDSAGGNLALALTAKLRDRGSELPEAIVLMSPLADLASLGESHTYNIYNDPMFGIAEGSEPARLKKPLLYAGSTNLQDKYLSPAYGEFDEFPPMLIQVGTWEVLESDSLTVYQKAKAKGVDVTLTRYEGMFHVFQMGGDLIPESKTAWQEVESFISQFVS